MLISKQGDASINRLLKMIKRNKVYKNNKNDAIGVVEVTTCNCIINNAKSFSWHPQAMSVKNLL